MSVYARMHVCMSSCLYMHACMYVCLYVYASISLSVFTCLFFVCLSQHLSGYLFVCLSARGMYHISTISFTLLWCRTTTLQKHTHSTNTLAHTRLPTSGVLATRVVLSWIACKVCAFVLFVIWICIVQIVILVHLTLTQTHILSLVHSLCRRRSCSCCRARSLIMTLFSLFISLQILCNHLHSNIHTHECTHTHTHVHTHTYTQVHIHTNTHTHSHAHTHTHTTALQNRNATRITPRF